MTTGLPSQTQVTELLGSEFARAGFEIEEVVIDSRARPPRIMVIADGETALDLELSPLCRDRPRLCWTAWMTSGTTMYSRSVLPVWTAR